MKLLKLSLVAIAVVTLFVVWNTELNKYTAKAQTGQTFSNTVIRSAFAYEQITFSTIALPFTAATYAPTVADQPAGFSHADYAEFNCNDNAQAAPNNQIRYRLDNVAPTAAIGVALGPNVGVIGVLQIWGFANISHFKAIRLGTTDVVCGVHYFKQSANIP